MLLSKRRQDWKLCGQPDKPHACVKTETKPVLFFLLLTFYPARQEGWGLYVQGRISRPRPCSPRWVTDPSVFVYPGLNVTRQPGPLIQHLCHHNMCHYLGAGHHFTSPLIGGSGVTKTVLGQHFELRPRVLQCQRWGREWKKQFADATVWRLLAC